MKRYNRLVPVLCAAFVFACGRPHNRVEVQRANPGVQRETDNDLLGLPKMLEYPNAVVLDQSGESTESAINRFFVFRTGDSLTAVKRFYEEAASNLWDEFGVSGSSSDRVVVQSFRSEEEDEGLFCILVKEGIGTLATLIYWQRHKPQAEL